MAYPKKSKKYIKIALLGVGVVVAYPYLKKGVNALTAKLAAAK